jgi:monovalent cation:H+ antiporter, CPA1 family
VLGVAIASRHSRVPYTVGLVLAGLIIGLIPGHPRAQLTPDLVMLVFLPALLFSGAWTYPEGELRRNWLPIALLSTVGVLITMLVSWIILVRFAGLSSQVALLFGAIISATDPVAVIAVFRSMRANHRLSAIVEGESLFNDATAVVAFKITLLLAIAHESTSGAHAALEFVELLGGGALVGIVVGFAGLFVLRFTDDYMVEAMGTLITAYGSYFIADQLGVSGLIAVIAAAMIVSRVGTRVGSITSTRQSVNQLWEFIAFVANSLLFLLMGLSVNLSDMISLASVSAWGIASVAISRVVSVYGLCGLSSFLGTKLPLRWQHVFVLGGLRGALSMALALSLPAAFPQRQLLITMVFSVVLFTIIIQGLLLAPVLVRLRVQADQPAIGS